MHIHRISITNLETRDKFFIHTPSMFTMDTSKKDLNQSSIHPSIHHPSIHPFTILLRSCGIQKVPKHHKSVIRAPSGDAALFNKPLTQSNPAFLKMEIILLNLWQMSTSLCFVKIVVLLSFGLCFGSWTKVKMKPHSSGCLQSHFSRSWTHHRSVLKVTVSKQI